MFSTSSFNSQSKSISKSSTFIKRQQYQKNRASQQRQKIRRTLRFQTLLDDLFNKNIFQNYSSTIDCPVEQIQAKLTNCMVNHDYMLLALSIVQIKSSNQFQQILNQEILQKFAQFSSSLLSKPQIIIIYRILSEYHSVFRQLICKKRQIINQLIKQIKKLKQSRYQQMYLDILQHLVPKYSKRYQQIMLDCFDSLSQLINNKIVPLKSGIKIMKSISPYIQEDRNISIPLIQRIIQCYNYEAFQQKKYQCTSMMIDCFVILTKVIFYQANVSIVCNLNIMKLLINARINLPRKIVEDYTNIHKLLYLLIKKTSQYELKLANDQFIKQKSALMYINKQLSLQIINSADYPLTTLMNDIILTENQSILGYKAFQREYIGLINILTQHTSAQVIQHHFDKSSFFSFLVDCVDHTDVQISYIAIDSIYRLLKNLKDPTYILTIFKDQFNLIPLLQAKQIHLNDKIAKKSCLILEIMTFYSAEY